MLVPLAERLEFLVRDLELPRVAERLVAAVFFVNNEHLEALPARGPDGPDGFIHIFLPIVPIDHGIDLEHDPILPAQRRELSEFLQMPPRAAADLDVCGLDEGVAGHGHDVNVRAVLGKPGSGDLAAVRDDGDGFEPQGALAVLGQLAEELGVHEGLVAGEVDLAHAGLLEEEHGALGVGEGLDVGGFGGVEAETWGVGRMGQCQVSGLKGDAISDRDDVPQL